MAAPRGRGRPVPAWMSSMPPPNGGRRQEQSHDVVGEWLENVKQEQLRQQGGGIHPMSRGWDEQRVPSHPGRASGSRWPGQRPPPPPSADRRPTEYRNGADAAIGPQWDGGGRRQPPLPRRAAPPVGTGPPRSIFVDQGPLRGPADGPSGPQRETEVVQGASQTSQAMVSQPPVLVTRPSERIDDKPPPLEKRASLESLDDDRRPKVSRQDSGAVAIPEDEEDMKYERDHRDKIRFIQNEGTEAYHNKDYEAARNFFERALEAHQLHLDKPLPSRNTPTSRVFADRDNVKCKLLKYLSRAMEKLGVRHSPTLARY